MLEYLYRLLTDKRVNCWLCRRKIGYVARGGHAKWVCAECNGGEPRAI